MLKMGPTYELGNLTHIPVDENITSYKSDDETESEVSEQYTGLKDTTYELMKKTMNDIDSVDNEQK